MRVFVTGACGFVGRSLSRALLGKGYRVYGLTRGQNSCHRVDGVEYLRGDLARHDGLDEATPAIRQADLIVHLAAIRKTWGVPETEISRVNVESGPSIMRLAERAQRFLFISSAAVYGTTGQRAATEDSQLRSVDRYGRSKVLAEDRILQTSRRYNLPTTVIRPGFLYGPGDTYGMIANLASLLSRGRFLQIGKGLTRLAPFFIDDLSPALIAALESKSSQPGCYNLGGIEPLSVETVVGITAQALGRQPPSVRVPESVARSIAAVLGYLARVARTSREPFLTQRKIDLFTRDHLYEVTRAQAELGFSPEVEFRDGIVRSVSWLRQAGLLI